MKLEQSVKVRDLRRSWLEASTRHRLATLGAVWGESLKGAPASDELAKTAEELARHGYHIVYEDDLLLGRTELETWTDKKYAVQIAGNELSRARGGPRCMTMPLEREDL